MRDNNSDFVRIDRFLPEMKLVRGSGIWYRQIGIRGHNGTYHYFNIENPSSESARREERMLQMFRIFNQ